MTGFVITLVLKKLMTLQEWLKLEKLVQKKQKSGVLM